MLDYLINLADDLGHWAYLGIFLVVALECQALLGLVMPGESLVLVGGFIASDVLGAAAAGLAWLALSITAVDVLRRSSSGR